MHIWWRWLPWHWGRVGRDIGVMMVVVVVVVGLGTVETGELGTVEAGQRFRGHSGGGEGGKSHRGGGGHGSCARANQAPAHLLQEVLP